MQLLARFAVGLVAVLHVVISAAEMFFWKCPRVYGLLDNRFHFDQAGADKVAPIVANAGLYNAFIAAGLVWSLFAASASRSLKFFFLWCVAIAGIYGAVTLKPDTLFLQTLPALVALGLVWRAKQAV
jgi:putative membrane protein